MKKRIVAINASPRVNWNTDLLVQSAAAGAEAAGASVQYFQLYQLEKYTGCISCFGCKKEKFKGRCICRDGLTPVLDAIREVTPYERQISEDSDTEYLQKLQDEGIKVITEIDKTLWQEAVQPIYDEYRDEIGAELLQRIQDKISEGE